MLIIYVRRTRYMSWSYYQRHEFSHLLGVECKGEKLIVRNLLWSRNDDNNGGKEQCHPPYGRHICRRRRAVSCVQHPWIQPGYLPVITGVLPFLLLLGSKWRKKQWWSYMTGWLWWYHRRVRPARRHLCAGRLHRHMVASRSIVVAFCMLPYHVSPYDLLPLLLSFQLAFGRRSGGGGRTVASASSPCEAASSLRRDHRAWRAWFARVQLSWVPIQSNGFCGDGGRDEIFWHSIVIFIFYEFCIFNIIYYYIIYYYIILYLIHRFN